MTKIDPEKLRRLLADRDRVLLMTISSIRNEVMAMRLKDKDGIEWSVLFHICGERKLAPDGTPGMDASRFIPMAILATRDDFDILFPNWHEQMPEAIAEVNKLAPHMHKVEEGEHN